MTTLDIVKTRRDNRRYRLEQFPEHNASDSCQDASTRVSSTA